MKSLILLILMLLIAMTLAGSLVHAQVETSIPCNPTPQGALVAKREKLASGGYGFCKIESCLPTHELISRKCILLPTQESPAPSFWVSGDTQVQERNSEVVVYASVKHRYSAGATVPLLVSASDAELGVDYELLSTEAVFAPRTRTSNPIKIKIKNRPGNQGDRDILLKLASGNTLKVSILESEGSTPNSMSLVVPSEVIEGESINVTLNFTHNLSRVFPTIIDLSVLGDKSALVLPAKITVPKEQSTHSVSIQTVDSRGTMGTRQVTLKIKNPISKNIEERVVQIKSSGPVLCDSDSYEQNGECISYTYEGISDPFPANPKNAACSGEVTYNRVRSCYKKTADGSQVGVASLDKCSFDPEEALSITYKSPARTGLEEYITDGKEIFSCAEGSTVKVVTARLCNEDFYNNGSSCSAITYQTVLGEFPENNLAVCGGSRTVSRTKTCVEMHGDTVVNENAPIAKCTGSEVLTQLQESPAGQVNDPISNGNEVSLCPAGSSEKQLVSRTCNFGFYDSGNQTKCLADEWVPDYSTYTPMTLLEAASATSQSCSGTITVTRNLLGCKGAHNPLNYVDKTNVVCSGFDIPQDISYQSPADNNVIVNLTVNGNASGSEKYSCALGSTQKDFVLRTCNSPGYYDNQTTCVAENFELIGTFPANEMQACNGTEVISASSSVCKALGASLILNQLITADSALYCSGIETPTELQKSPSGSIPLLITNGSGTMVCDEGSESGVRSITCNTNYVKHPSQEVCNYKVHLVSDIQVGAGSSNPQNFVETSDSVFFTAKESSTIFSVFNFNKATHEVELVRSDIGQYGYIESLNDDEIILIKNLSGSSTKIIELINKVNRQITPVRTLLDMSGTPTTERIVVNGKLFFTHWNINTGNELWFSNGTFNNTGLVFDFTSGVSSSDPKGFVYYNGKIVFSANGLLKSMDPATFVVTHHQSPGAIPGNMSVTSALKISSNGLVFCGQASGASAIGRELYGLNSSFATFVVRDIYTNNTTATGGCVDMGESFGGKVVFKASANANNDIEPWVTDGSSLPAATFRLKDIKVGNTFSSNPKNFVKISDSKLLFTAEVLATADNQLFVTDGTTNGTQVVKTMNSGNNTIPAVGAISGDNALVYSGVGTDTMKLYQTNGNVDNLTELFSPQQSSAASFKNFFQLTNGKVLMQGVNTNRSDFELWIYEP